MVSDPPPTPTPSPGAAPDESLLARVRDQQQRDERAQRTSSRRLWQTVAHVGVLGWLIALPTVGGAYLGHQADIRFASGVTWAMCGLSLGLVAGAYLIWRTVHLLSEEAP